MQCLVVVSSEGAVSSCGVESYCGIVVVFG
jgi:hypothetical protein